MVANLRNVDEDLAKRVAAGLAIALPKANRRRGRRSTWSRRRL